ncbi:hypothetical protein [Pediococcus acidilactici]|uniref:hypothetical protein n=1 Tax=Pediococcus acidilactici TaxID=1254 RepID=UPI001E2D52C6|nr:hypothetical protein [Pediococcus acidilactici]
MVNIRKSPAQDVYDHYFMLSQKLGYDTYDYLPPDKVKYPFVVISGVEDNKITQKQN